MYFDPLEAPMTPETRNDRLLSLAAIVGLRTLRELKHIAMENDHTLVPDLTEEEKGAVFVLAANMMGDTTHRAMYVEAESRGTRITSLYDTLWDLYLISQDGPSPTTIS